jgi:hypothetical protein
LTARDLTVLNRCYWELVFLVPSVKQVQMVVLLLFFLFIYCNRMQFCIAYAEFASMVPVSVLIRIRMLLLAKL